MGYQVAVGQLYHHRPLLADSQRQAVKRLCATKLHEMDQSNVLYSSGTTGMAVMGQRQRMPVHVAPFDMLQKQDQLNVLQRGKHWSKRYQVQY